MSSGLSPRLCEPCVVCGGTFDVRRTPTFSSHLDLCGDCREVAIQAGLVDPRGWDE